MVRGIGHDSHANFIGAAAISLLFICICGEFCECAVIKIVSGLLEIHEGHHRFRLAPHIGIGERTRRIGPALGIRDHPAIGQRGLYLVNYGLAEIVDDALAVLTRYLFTIDKRGSSKSPVRHLRRC
ncbi:hypothetical protein BKG69_14055 [Mycobacteroides chelonae]|nr:hypothetical protein BKG69_14055 [Mycobacteroides chelonae]